MKTNPTQRLQCCCCGNDTIGRQWPNRVNGYGLCVPCIDYVARGQTAAEMRQSYGERGVHYDVTVGSTMPELARAA